MRWRSFTGIVGLASCPRGKQLSLAAFFARLEDASVPVFILGMRRAEPPPADAAMESCGGVTGLIHGGNGLTRPLEVPGFCLIHLLQHGPSSYGQYTPANCRWPPGEIARATEEAQSEIASGKHGEPCSQIHGGVGFLNLYSSQDLPSPFPRRTRRRFPTCPSLRSSPSV